MTAYDLRLVAADLYIYIVILLIQIYHKKPTFSHTQKTANSYQD